MARILISFLLIAVLTIPLLSTVGCGYEITDSEWQILQVIANAVDAHGHARMPLIDRRAVGLMAIMFLCMAQEMWVPFPYDAPPWDVMDVQLPPRLPVMVPDRRQTARSVAAADPYSNHNVDGLWYGRTSISCSGGSGMAPCIVLLNGSPEGGCAASIVFLNVNESVGAGRPVWSAFYTDAVQNQKNYPSFKFEDISSKALTSVIKHVRKLKFSLSMYSTPNNTMWAYLHAKPWKGTSDLFGATLRLTRALDSGGFNGIWSGGLTERVYAGTYIDPAIFQPVAIHVCPGDAGMEMYLYVFLGYMDGITPIVNGSNLTFSFYTPNGMTNGSLNLVNGNQVTGTIYDPFTRRTIPLTFKPAGTEGLPVIVKRVKPSFVALNKTGKTVTIKISGKNFAPGAMPYFDRNEVVVRKVAWINPKTLTAVLAAVRPLKPGTKIGVKVVNPDNRSAIKAGALTGK